MNDEWPKPPREPGPFAGGPAVGPPAGPPVAHSPGSGGDPWGPGSAGYPVDPSAPAVADDLDDPDSIWVRTPEEIAAQTGPPADPGAGPASWAASATAAPPTSRPGVPFTGGLPFSPPGAADASPGTHPGQGYPTQGYPTQPYPAPPSTGQPYQGQPYPGQQHPGAPGGPSTAWATMPSAWQPPGGPGVPGPPARRQVDRAPAWLLGVAALVVVLLVAGAAYVVTSKSGPSFPDEWDPRVAPLAAFVAEERGLTFEHPVTVNFLTAEEYSAATRSDTGDGGLTDEEKAELEDYVAVFRALGLVEGTFDVESAMNQLADAGTLAFYDPSVKEVFVRGTELTPSLRVTLVHELTHVLQDQHFDLERIGEAEGPVAATLRAMAEGDAGRVEDVYVAEGLTDDERAEYEQQQTQDSADVDGDLADVPQILIASFGAPYAFGPAVVQIAFASDGNAGVDALFEAPPSEFALFDPIGFPPAEHPAVDQVPIEIDVPEGGEELSDGSFGPVYWYLLLASRLGDEVAFAAVEGVEGDGFLAYRDDGKVCVKGAARAPDAEADELRTALQDWAAKGPAGAAEVGGSGGRVDLTSCDPGADAASGGEVANDLLFLPVRRNYIFAQTIESTQAEGLTGDQAECYANGVFDAMPVADIVDPEWEPSLEQLAEMQEIAVSCR